MMMRSILLFLTLLLPSLAEALQPEEVRIRFRQAGQDEAEAQRLHAELLAQHPTPLLRAYLAATTALQAKYAFNPYNKVSYCKTSSELFQQAIAEDPRNVEMRYLRLAVQLNLPKFLGMSNEVAEDRRVILEGLSFLSDTGFRSEIAHYLLQEKQCSRDELRCCLP